MQGFHGQVALFTATRVVINTGFRMVYPFLNVFARGLGVDLVSFSLVLSGRSFAGLLAPFLAPIADLRGRKVSMLLGLGAMVAASLLITFIPSFAVFSVGLIAFVMGNAIFIPAMQAYIGDRVPFQRRGRMLGITELSWSLAFIVGIPLVGWIIETFGRTPQTMSFAWRAPFPFIAALGIIFMLLIAWRIPNNRAQTPAIGNGFQTIGHILSNPVVLFGLGFSIAATFSNELINLVFGVWLEDQYGLKLAALGAASAVIGVSELSGEGLSAMLTDRLGKKVSSRLGLLTSALAAILLYFSGGLGVFPALLGLFFFYLGFEFTVVSSMSLMSEAHPAARATVMASVMACFSIGRALAALFAARLYEQGFLLNLIVALVFNAAALALLAGVRIKEK